ISQSQTDVQPVFDTILSSAIRLMRAQAGALTRITGDTLDLAAFRSTDNRGESTIRAAFPLPLQSEGLHAKAVRGRAPVNITEAQTDPELPDFTRSIARAVGYQSMVAVPMLHRDEALGAIAVTRREPAGFKDDEIALLQTFADQAVIAIENVRLFNEIKEALEQQTATAEILRVIASSPTDLHPVLEVVAESAARFCGATNTAIFRLEGELLRRVAVHGPTPTSVPIGGTITVSPQSVAGRAVRTRKSIHIEDILALPETEFRETVERDRQHGVR